MAPPVRRPRQKYAAAALSPSCLRELRVPAEFAARLVPAAGEEDRAVLVVGPLGTVWRVELRTQRKADGGGCWLGNGWAELAAAHGIGEGWSVVLRCERRGMATVAAFDPGCCLARFCTPHRAGVTSKNRPRFIKLLQQDDLQKMRIPDEFVQQHLTESWACTHQNAMIFSTLGKFWRVKLDRGQSDALLGDGWSRFLTVHDLSEGNILLFRYEGNMVFSVEVFLQNGCLKEHNRTDALNLTDNEKGSSTSDQQSVRLLQAPPVSKKRKIRKRNVSPISAKKIWSPGKYANIAPRHSFMKKITGYCLNKLLSVKGNFCSSVGLEGACTIKLQTCMGSTKSWTVDLKVANTYGYIKGPGWKRFCEDNNIEEGDCCTFNVVEATVWHVVIMPS